MERAVQLSQDLDALNLLRQDTRSRFLESDLCNAPKFVAGLEEAFQQMWTRFVEDDEGAREPPLPREVGLCVLSHPFLCVFVVGLKTGRIVGVSFRW